MNSIPVLYYVGDASVDFGSFKRFWVENCNNWRNIEQLCLHCDLDSQRWHFVQTKCILPKSVLRKKCRSLDWSLVYSEYESFTDDMVRELSQQPIRGLIWNTGTVMVSEEPARRLSREGMPIVATSPFFEHIDVVCSEFSVPGIAWADYVRKNKSKRSLYYLPEWHSTLLLQWLYKEEVTTLHPGQEIPQEKYDIIVTDAAHHRQMQAFCPSAEVHDWNVLPSGSRLVPDYRRIAMFAVERLLQLMKGRDIVVEKTFIPFL